MLLIFELRQQKSVLEVADQSLLFKLLDFMNNQ